jgi:poly-gamma-glutamate synthesis protein (capsule biosynthesis protein)
MPIRGTCAALVLLTAGAATAKPIAVVAGGDLQLAPSTRPRDLAALAPLFAGADLRFANLEGPLTDGAKPSGLDAQGRPIPGETIRFAAPSALASALAPSLNMVSLANNHALDQGDTGRNGTAEALATTHIESAFDTHSAFLPSRDLTVLARSFPPDADLDREQRLVDEVRGARARGPVIVSLHWGHSGSLLPTAAQRRLARRIVDAGASAILGHGPHAPQGAERIGRAIVAYSLGNLALACRCSDERDAYLIRFTLDDDGAARQVLLQPLRAGLGGAAPALSRDAGLAELLENLSRDLGSVARRTADGVAIE